MIQTGFEVSEGFHEHDVVPMYETTNTTVTVPVWEYQASSELWGHEQAIRLDSWMENCMLLIWRV